MKAHRFIAEASVICDRCGQMVKVGEAAVAEFYPRDEKCRIRHENCPTTTPSRPKRNNPFVLSAIVRQGFIKLTTKNRK